MSIIKPWRHNSVFDIVSNDYYKDPFCKYSRLAENWTYSKYFFEHKVPYFSKLQILLFLIIFDFGFTLPKSGDKNLFNVINELEGKVENLDDVKSNARSNSLSKNFGVKKVPNINNAEPRHPHNLGELTSNNCGEKKIIFFYNLSKY